MFYTSRLMLRSIDAEADTKRLLQWMNGADDAMEIQPPGPLMPRSRDTVKKMVERLADKEDKLPYFIVCDRPTDQERKLDGHDDYFLKDGKARYPAIGMLNISISRGYSPLNRCVTLGIILDERHRDKGFGTELLTWALSYCFNDLGMHRIELGAAATNARALHVYEKLGFVREGLRRKAALREGEWRDIVDLGLLEEEWRQRQTKT